MQWNLSRWLAAVFFVLVSGPWPVEAQWAATYGTPLTDHSESIQQTADGGYVVAGFKIGSAGNLSDVYVVKLASDGTSEWQKTYGGTSHESAYSIEQTADQGYIVAARTRSFGIQQYDLWLLKLDPQGGVEWQKSYDALGSAWPRAVHQTADGGYVVAGQILFTEQAGEVFVAKVTASGALQWHNVYGGLGDEFAYGLQVVGPQAYLVVGYTSSFGAGGKDVWILKLGAGGSIDVQKTFGGAGDDEGRAVWPTTDGGIIVAASTQSFGSGGSDLWLLKLDGGGETQWQKTYGGPGNEAKVRSIEQTADGGYIVAVGETTSFGAGAADAWILKLDAAGSVEWEKAYGGALYEEAEQLRQTSDGGYIVCGNTLSFGAGDDDFMILKLGPDGSVGPSCIVRDTMASVFGGVVQGVNSSAVVIPLPVTPHNTSAFAIDAKNRRRALCPVEVP